MRRFLKKNKIIYAIFSTLLTTPILTCVSIGCSSNSKLNGSNSEISNDELFYDLVKDIWNLNKNNINININRFYGEIFSILNQDQIENIFYSSYEFESIINKIKKLNLKFLIQPKYYDSNKGIQTINVQFYGPFINKYSLLLPNFVFSFDFNIDGLLKKEPKYNYDLNLEVYNQIIQNNKNLKFLDSKYIPPRRPINTVNYKNNFYELVFEKFNLNIDGFDKNLINIIINTNVVSDFDGYIGFDLYYANLYVGSYIWNGLLRVNNYNTLLEIINNNQNIDLTKLTNALPSQFPWEYHLHKLLKQNLNFSSISFQYGFKEFYNNLEFKINKDTIINDFSGNLKMFLSFKNIVTKETINIKLSVINNYEVARKIYLSNYGNKLIIKPNQIIENNTIYLDQFELIINPDIKGWNYTNRKNIVVKIIDINNENELVGYIGYGDNKSNIKFYQEKILIYRSL